MKFSCLVANYNNGKFLLECIHSLMNQSYHNIEIVVLDDCSTDNSLELLDTLQDTRLRIKQNKENGGCGFTKASLVELATGDYCGFIDPDDLLAFNAVELMVEKLNSTENASMVYSRYVTMREDGYVENPEGRAKKQRANKMHFDHHYISHFVAFKRACYFKTKGINPNIPRAVDQDLYLKLEEVGDVLYVDEPLYFYRHSSQSISLNENLHKATYWEFKVHEDTCIRRGINPETHFSKWFSRKIDLYKKPLEVIENSKEYKLGSKLLHPKSWFK